MLRRLSNTGVLSALLLLVGIHLAVTALAHALRHVGADDPPPVVAVEALPAVALPDSAGAIEDAVVQVDPRLERAWPSVVEVLRGLASRARIHVLCGARVTCEAFLARATAAGVTRPDRFRLHVVDKAITGWSRDRFTVRETAWHGPVLVAPPEPTRGEQARLNDWIVPWVLGEATGVPVATAPFRFDGGDLVASEDTVFATTMLWDKNADGELDRPAFERLLATTLGRPAVLLGDEAHPIPLHHIGMFVTPIGDRTVLVGDADAGAEALSELSLALDGPPAALEIRGPDGRTLVADVSAERRARFRHVAEALRARGFEVVSLPLVPLEGWGTYITYNNVLIDEQAGRKVVFLPTYRLPALDARARRIFEARGFEVRPVDVADVFELHGSVRCLVNVLRRAPRPAG